MAQTAQNSYYEKGRRVSISSKRQITIPIRYFTKLGFSDEAECFVRNDELIIRPVKSGSDDGFAEQILAELIAEGYSGAELLDKFKQMRAKVRPAVEAMIDDSKRAAEGEGEYYTYEDVFGTEAE